VFAVGDQCFDCLFYLHCPLIIPVYVCFLHLLLKIDQKEEDEPSTSANPVLEMELTEEKLPMTLSRQEVRQFIKSAPGCQ